MTDPKLIVKLEAICYSWKDALKFVDVLQDITTKKEFAGELIEECSIFYVDPSEVGEPKGPDVQCTKIHSHTKRCLQ